ncbi:MAG: hypothetical protein KDE15_07275 [Erythrobacter sp.]|nr:hypothetical protein [Erythrobacter sp.]
MAMAKPARSIRSIPWLKLLVVLALVGGTVAWFFGEGIMGRALAGTAYAAKNACSCRYIGGHELAQCEDDFLPGMEMVFLSEDEEAQSVTASVPLIRSTTATYREGFGCVLEGWDG